MSKFILSKAMGSIPDDMLQEAMDVEKKSRTGWVIFRAAACLAVVIGLIVAALGLHSGTEGIVADPGILAVTVYAADETPYVISSPGTVLHDSIYWDSASSFSFGCPITLSVSDEYDCSDGVVFQITVDGGGLLLEVEDEETFTSGTVYKYMPPQFSAPNHINLYWTDIHPYTDSNEYTMVDRNTAHVEIVIYDGEKIIGYSVLRFSKMTCTEVIRANPEWIAAPDHKECSGDHMINCYRVEMLASVYFPKVNGEYQNITLEYVDNCIAKARME